MIQTDENRNGIDRYPGRFLKDFCMFATLKRTLTFSTLSFGIAEYLLYASIMKTTTTMKIATEHCTIWCADAKMKMGKEVPSAKMKIRIYLFATGLL